MSTALLRTSVFLVLLALAATACDIRCQWSEWKEQHHKAYSTHEEDEHRFQVFRQNLEEYAARNAEPGQAAVYGPDKFSDLTWEEFSARYLVPGGTSALSGAPERAAPDAPMKRGSLPDRFTSPYTLAARQQSTCGACWAFTSAAVIEGSLLRTTGHAEWVSPQNMLDCATYSTANYDGCQGYRPAWIFNELTDRAGKTGGGVVFDRFYPYLNRMGTCRHPLSSPGNVTVTGYFTEKFDETVGSGLYSRLMQYGPLGIALNSRNLNGYKSGIVVPTNNCLYTQSGSFGADHAVTLVGWGSQNGIQYWLVKNSWGTDWGEPKDFTTGGAPQGYFRIQRGLNACHIADDVAVGAFAQYGK
eukprot:m51a1_g1902 hypothetical protein (358) ;mRNA; r:778488-779807